MKVYLLLEGEYEGFCTFVFATKELAEKHIKAIHILENKLHQKKSFFEIQEMEVKGAN